MSLENLFAKYPKLKPVAQAIEEYAAGKPITSRCFECGELLSVHHFELQKTGTTATRVSCPNGCTNYHDTGEISD